MAESDRPNSTARSFGPPLVSGVGGRQPVGFFGRAIVRFSLWGTLIGSVLLMNVYFAWSSHVLWSDQALRTVISNFARDEMRLIGLASWYVGTKGLAVREFIDFEVVALALIVAATSFLLYLRRGVRKAFLKMLEIGSLSIMPLGIEIYFLDQSEFNIHASIIQVETGFLPWFSNADVLYLAMATFVIAAAIDWRLSNRSKPQSIGKDKLGIS